MKINRDNYEAYFLDYHEEQLSSEMVQEVLRFVEMNPDLQSVFDEFEPVTLPEGQNIVFEKKASLKKNNGFVASRINELNCEEFMIAETEGILDQEQISALNEFISSNPQFEKDRNLFSHTHLPVDTVIVFEAKESLKQKAIPVGPINADTFELYLARELEGDLNSREVVTLAEFMRFNPHLEKDRNLYKNTILSADSDVVFTNKKQLKQSITPLRQIVFYALSAAAFLALIMSVYFLLDRNEIPKNIAHNGNIKPQIERPVTNPTKEIPDANVPVSDQSEKMVVPASNPINSIASNKIIPGRATANNNQASIQLASNRREVELLPSRSVQQVTTKQFVDPQFTFIRTSQMYMNQNLEFYYNLKLSEQIQYAQLNTKDKNPGKTILNAATDKAEDLFVLNQKTSGRVEKQDFSLWTFAELGVQTFNTVTSSELELKLQKDEEGKVVAYGLQSGLIDFEREVRK